jgi:hypothetical protein
MAEMNIQKFIDRGLSPKYASAYKSFDDEFDKLKNTTPLEAIKDKTLRMYAVDQSTHIKDITETLDIIRKCIPSIRKICNKPKSHLKSVNEIRPIDTVKRVGYESIPYLASHSEDWLARTATGLKPARLFSRVEEEDFQIYENRVVKTLIDKTFSFFKKYIQELENNYKQIKVIMDSDTQTQSFGFDIGFQKAVKMLLTDNFLGDKKQIEQLELAEKLLKESKELYNKFHDLKQSRLYKLLYHTKMVTNPLNETNILLLDRDYKKVFLLWKEIQKASAPEKNEEIKIQPSDIQKSYYNFCYALIQFAFYSLNFSCETDDRFVRGNDNICVCIIKEDSTFCLQFKDITKRELSIESRLIVPLNNDGNFGKFSRSGDKLYWENDTTEEDIESFCKKLKVNMNKKDKNHEQQRQYQTLKKAITEKNKKADKVKESYLYITPLCCEVKDDEIPSFKSYVQDEYSSKNKDQKNLIALPEKMHNEQKLTNYAVNNTEKIGILPLTLFDINSYRRIQKIILKILTEFDSDKCPYCGGNTKKKDNGLRCNDCELIMTKTICPNEDCKHEYKYLWYSTKDERLKEMKEVSTDDFFNKDSLFQYKNIVEMEINEKLTLAPICPKCGIKIN